jgi:hypothetical protein
MTNYPTKLLLGAAMVLMLTSAVYAAPPAKAIQNAAAAGINLTDTIRSNAGGGNGGEYGAPGPVEVIFHDETIGTPEVVEIQKPSPTSNPNSWTYISEQTNSEVTTYEQTTPEIDPGKSGQVNQAQEPGDDVDTWTVTTTQTDTITDAPGLGQDGTVAGEPETTCEGDCPID